MPQATAQARPIGPPGYSQTMPRKPESAAAARRFTDTALSCWGLGELAVTDFGRALPVERRAGDSDEGGRGLLLMVALASDWGTNVIPEAAPEAPGEAAEDE
ncbi:ATP-binding protein [Streptomyces sp. SID7909]|uniref:ATP-binding protein n=1 Tax=Streptomyces sp. SID7909 TaxID=2706092 RepID=UPI001EF39FF3|nr:ATP-binding protein [Streptomyces sp. SID7909]